MHSLKMSPSDQKTNPKWSLLPSIAIFSDHAYHYLVNKPMNNDEHDNHERKKKSKSSDADELREIAAALPEIFDAINKSVPQMITGLIGAVYSPEAAGNIAAGIGKFYSGLIAEGIPEDVALDMTKKFVGALDFTKLMSMVSDESRSSAKIKIRHSDDEDEESD